MALNQYNSEAVRVDSSTIRIELENPGRIMEMYFGLGSNLGDREANVLKAERLLCEGVEYEFGYPALPKISSLMETRPLGFSSDNLFLNAVLRLEIPDLKAEDFSEIWTNGRKVPGILDAREAKKTENHLQLIDIYALILLNTCKGIEQQMGRNDNLEFGSEGERVYHDRIIDIDILFLGPFRINLPSLQIPHPQIAERDFVKIPLREVASDFLKREFGRIFA